MPRTAETVRGAVRVGGVAGGEGAPVRVGVTRSRDVLRGHDDRRGVLRDRGRVVTPAAGSVAVGRVAGEPVRGRGADPVGVHRAAGSGAHREPGVGGARVVAGAAEREDHGAGAGGVDRDGREDHAATVHGDVPLAGNRAGDTATGRRTWSHHEPRDAVTAGRAPGTDPGVECRGEHPAVVDDLLHPVVVALDAWQGLVLAGAEGVRPGALPRGDGRCVRLAGQHRVREGHPRCRGTQAGGTGERPQDDCVGALSAHRGEAVEVRRVEEVLGVRRVAAPGRRLGGLQGVRRVAVDLRGAHVDADHRWHGTRAGGRCGQAGLGDGVETAAVAVEETLDGVDVSADVDPVRVGTESRLVAEARAVRQAGGATLAVVRGVHGEDGVVTGRVARRADRDEQGRVASQVTGPRVDVDAQDGGVPPAGLRVVVTARVGQEGAVALGRGVVGRGLPEERVEGHRTGEGGPTVGVDPYREVDLLHDGALVGAQALVGRLDVEPVQAARLHGVEATEAGGAGVQPRHRDGGRVREGDGRLLRLLVGLGPGPDSRLRHGRSGQPSQVDRADALESLDAATGSGRGGSDGGEWADQARSQQAQGACRAEQGCGTSHDSSSSTVKGCLRG